ncbi:Cotton fiber protein [Quillaja saponaria]|uniref:Cotton fiber protein n=1 Tax=Quillaja saponaria TaxID=32244 RepID=A0AAD7M2X0_QUISA|nr:Cotton fiber protein [Quillaja saponaria]
MAKPPPNLVEDHTSFYKPNNDYTKEKLAKGTISFFAFIFSIFIYISVFYVFNLSPYTLMNNTYFWFLLSNTLILIIAADYGAFYSSQEKQDLYQEYAMHRQPKLAQNFNNIPKEELHEDLHEKREPINDQKREIPEPERVLHVILQNDTQKEKTSESSREEKKLSHALQGDLNDDHFKLACDNKERIQARTYRRSKSDCRPKRMVIDESKNIVMRRSPEPMINKQENGGVKEENNEFSNMTDEELNRRVQEFIDRFNKQIRQQAAESIKQN